MCSSDLSLLDQPLPFFGHAGYPHALCSTRYESTSRRVWIYEPYLLKTRSPVESPAMGPGALSHLSLTRGAHCWKPLTASGASPGVWAHTTPPLTLPYHPVTAEDWFRPLCKVEVSLSPFSPRSRWATLQFLGDFISFL